MARPKVGKYLTPSGRQVSKVELDNLFEGRTLNEAANILGYTTVESVKRVYKKLNDGVWVPRKPFIKTNTRMREGVITYMTPNGTIVDADMVNHMLAEFTSTEVAEKLGYKHRNSLQLLFKKRLNEKVKRNNFSLRNNDREFMAEIHKFLLNNRYAPSNKELVEITGHDSRTISSKIEKLVKANYLSKVTGKAHTLRLTEKGLSEILPDHDEQYMEFETKMLEKLNTLYR